MTHVFKPMPPVSRPFLTVLPNKDILSAEGLGPV